MQDIAPSMGDLVSSNAKARLDQGPVATFTAYRKDDGSSVEVDPRTFDPAWMTRDKGEADRIIAARLAAEQAERDRLAAIEKAKFDAAVDAEVKRRMSQGK